MGGQLANLSPFGSTEIFVSDHVILSEGVREAVSFFDTRLASLARPAIEYDVDEEDDRPWTSRFYEVLRNPTASATRKTKRSKRIRPPSWLFGTLLHMVKGISLVGIAAAFHGYIGASLLAHVECCSSLTSLTPARRSRSHLLPLPHR